MEHCFDKWSRAEKNRPAENSIHFTAASNQPNGCHPMLVADSQVMSSLMPLNNVLVNVVHQQSSRMPGSRMITETSTTNCRSFEQAVQKIKENMTRLLAIVQMSTIVLRVKTTILWALASTLLTKTDNNTVAVLMEVANVYTAEGSSCNSEVNNTGSTFFSFSKESYDYRNVNHAPHPPICSALCGKSRRRPSIHGKSYRYIISMLYF